MIIVMHKDATQVQIDGVVAELTAHDLQATVIQGTERIVIGAVGDERRLDVKHLETLAGVEKAVRIVKQYKMVSREFHQDNKIIKNSAAERPSFLPIRFRCARETRTDDPRGELPFLPLGNPIGLCQPQSGRV